MWSSCETGSSFRSVANADSTTRPPPERASARTCLISASLGFRSRTWSAARRISSSSSWSIGSARLAASAAVPGAFVSETARRARARRTGCGSARIFLKIAKALSAGISRARSRTDRRPKSSPWAARSVRKSASPSPASSLTKRWTARRTASERVRRRGTSASSASARSCFFSIRRPAARMSAFWSVAVQTRSSTAGLGSARNRSTRSLRCVSLDHWCPFRRVTTWGSLRRPFRSLSRTTTCPPITGMLSERGGAQVCYEK